MNTRQWIQAILVAIFLIVTGILSYLTYTNVRTMAAQAHRIFDSPPTLLPHPTPTLDPGITPTPGPSPTPGIEVEVGAERVTILLLGIDQREGEEGPWRTDTMILLSLDPVRMTGSMLSIPRDLWVNIPGYEPGRINTANYIGDLTNYPGGGPRLAMRTVEANLGVPVDHYVLVNFNVFLSLVEIIDPPDDPIEICVEEEIDDPDYPDWAYGTIYVHFDPGCQPMTPEQLLQYARTRATSGGDFDRARRQQEVINALRDRVLSLGGVSALISEAPRVWDMLVNGGLRTDLSLQQAINLAFLAQEVPRENIRSAVLDTRYVTLATSDDGSEVLLPRQGAIRALVRELFGVEPPSISEEDLERLAANEGAWVSVVNGTDRAGLATQTVDFLSAHGLYVADVGNADRQDYQETVIYDQSGKIYTARYIAMLLGLPEDSIVSGPDPAAPTSLNYDVRVILGADFQGW